jgi:hypothetical protein
MLGSIHNIEQAETGLSSSELEKTVSQSHNGSATDLPCYVAENRDPRASRPDSVVLGLTQYCHRAYELRELLRLAPLGYDQPCTQLEQLLLRSMRKVPEGWSQDRDFPR